MSVHCKLGETDIPPVGCQGFDPNWCKLQMECPFLEDDTEETSKKLLDAYKKNRCYNFQGE